MRPTHYGEVPTIHLEFIGASYGGSERKEAEGYNVERRMREID